MGTALTDRRGYRFPLLRQRLPEGCLIRLMNSLSTDVLIRVRAAGYAPLMTLTDESGEALLDAIRVWRGEKIGSPITSAHWSRPIE